MRAYEDCLERHEHGARAVVRRAADDKENARLIVSQVVLDTMGRLKMRYPTPNPARLKELRAIRTRLLK